MSKNTELKLVGQPIFSQVLKLIDKWDFNKLVKAHNSDRYYKSFKSWDYAKPVACDNFILLV